MTEMNTYTFEPQDADKPEQLVILLHGLGSHGQDLIALAPYFAKVLPKAMFVSPDAPFACDMVPPGYGGSYQWFSLQDRAPDKILAGVKTAAPLLDGYIQEQMDKYNLPAEKVALIGFSQGTMMSLYVGPRFQKGLAGVLGYSGALIWEESAGGKSVGESLNKIPVQLFHGDADDVVPVSAYHDAMETLANEGFPVSGQVIPYLPHSIDEAGIQGGMSFLQNIFDV